MRIWDFHGPLKFCVLKVPSWVLSILWTLFGRGIWGHQHYGVLAISSLLAQQLPWLRWKMVLTRRELCSTTLLLHLPSSTKKHFRVVLQVSLSHTTFFSHVPAHFFPPLCATPPTTQSKTTKGIWEAVWWGRLNKGTAKWKNEVLCNPVEALMSIWPRT